MIEHRKELREKVEIQQKVLEEALKVSEAAGHPADRISALNTELSVVADSLTGGWDTMSDVTAERLSKWLEYTRHLGSAEKPNGVMKPNPPQPADAQVQEVTGGMDKN